jgi:predicted HD phosphohydrolase
MTALIARSVEDVDELLKHYCLIEESIYGDIPAVLVSHGVQCAELLAAEYPEDQELHVAGLLHDIGLLIVPGDEIGHPQHGADYTRLLFGDRVADIIRLHVDAQMYLEATVNEYRITPPPTAGFAQQPLPMTPRDIRRFEAERLFREAVALRLSDDRGCDTNRRENGFEPWVSLMRVVAANARRQRTTFP